MSKPSKKQIALAVLELSKNSSKKKIAESLASYLADNHRTNELDAIMREIEVQREQMDGISEVTIKSQNKIDESFAKKVVKLMDIERSVINYEINKDLVGGVRAEANGRVLDLTVRNRLNLLKEGVN